MCIRDSRYTEVVEDGIAAGNVIPDDFEPNAEGLAHVRRNLSLIHISEPTRPY